MTFKLSEKTYLVKDLEKDNEEEEFMALKVEDIKEFIKLLNIDGENEVIRQGEINRKGEEDNMFHLGKIQGILWVLDRCDNLTGFEDEKEARG